MTIMDIYIYIYICIYIYGNSRMLATTPQFSLPRCPKTRGAFRRSTSSHRRDRVPLRCVGLGRTLGCHMPLLPVLAVPSHRGMREEKTLIPTGVMTPPIWWTSDLFFLGYRMGPPQICERWFVNHYIYIYITPILILVRYIMLLSTIFSHLFGNGSRYRLGAPSCRSLTDLHHFCMTDRYW